jgi:hypothetical protein
MFFTVSPGIVLHARRIRISDHRKPKLGIMELFSFVAGYSGIESTSQA